MKSFLVRDAALSAYKEGRAAHPGGWRPIETAPKDGSVLLLWDGEAQDMGWMSNCHIGFWSEPIDAPGDWIDGMGRREEFYPTHWRPLPSPPVKEGE